jgi:hypothetical protein
MVHSVPAHASRTMNTTNSILFHSVVGLAAITLATQSGLAATVSVNGLAAKQTTPIPDWLEPDATARTHVSSKLGFSATLQVTSLTTSNRQTLQLLLSDVTLRSSGDANQLVRIQVSQDFITKSGFVPITDTDTTNTKSLAQHEATTSVDTTTLPDTTDQFSKDDATSHVNGGPSVSLLMLREGLYRLTASYQFVIPRGQTTGRFLLGEKDGVSGQLILVPLPPAAWAGLAGFGMLAGAHLLRRRRIRARD